MGWLKFWIWRVFNFPYVFPPGHYIVKDVEDTDREIILDGVILQSENGGMTFVEYHEGKEREL